MRLTKKSYGFCQQSQLAESQARARQGGSFGRAGGVRSRDRSAFGSPVSCFYALTSDLSSRDQSLKLEYDYYSFVGAVYSPSQRNQRHRWLAEHSRHQRRPELSRSFRTAVVRKNNDRNPSKSTIRTKLLYGDSFCTALADNTNRPRLCNCQLGGGRAQGCRR